MIFRTNQGTGEHLKETIDLGAPKSYFSGRLFGIVSAKPKSAIGGHVYFRLKNESGEISCACYEPTGDLRKLALELVPGDNLEVGGGIRKSTFSHPKILNLEYIRPLELKKVFQYRNPRCPKCGGTTASKGVGQGYVCKKCGQKLEEREKVAVAVQRNIVLKTYLPPIRAHRHLTKPLERSKNEQRKFDITKLLEGWIA